MSERPEFYILNAEGDPWAVDRLTWAQWFGQHDRRLARDVLPDGRVISTVFLGLDHNMLGGPPEIFETLVFAGADVLDVSECQRYATRAQALAGHQRLVARLRDL